MLKHDAKHGKAKLSAVSAVSANRRNANSLPTGKGHEMSLKLRLTNVSQGCHEWTNQTGMELRNSLVLSFISADFPAFGDFICVCGATQILHVVSCLGPRHVVFGLIETFCSSSGEMHRSKNFWHASFPFSRIHGQFFRFSYFCAWYFMIFHDISWYFMIFHDISWYFMTFHDISWYFMIFLMIFLMIFHACHGIEWGRCSAQASLRPAELMRSSQRVCVKCVKCVAKTADVFRTLQNLKAWLSELRNTNRINCPLSIQRQQHRPHQKSAWLKIMQWTFAEGAKHRPDQCHRTL